METIETDRLILRRLLPEDYLAMAAWDMDERVYKYLLGTACKSPEEPLSWLPKKDPDSKTNILMLVKEKSDGHAVGIYALNHDVDRDVWILSYVNRYDDWGKGYTAEGMKALMDHAVKKYGAHTFEGECAKENVGSSKVLQKLGMVYDHDSSYTKNDGSATFESEVYLLTVHKSILLQWGRIVMGLLVFALGVHLTIFANIGLAPWDCLGMGIADHTPLNYGLSMTCIAVTVLVIDILLKEQIGYGTVIDALLTGNFIQIFNYLNPFENHNMWLGIICMLVGFVIMAVGMMIYMKAGQCCGPRDALLVGLGKRLNKVPIGIVEIILWAVVLLAGWFLGGPVGIGTLISVFGAGLMMQMVYSALHFEPRKIHHRNIVDVTKELIKSNNA
ncbi:MAG: GNAT family N-acetyltransferase [Lachnospiraceae bacterium]|nr:GNAT family N-acetyltransferase [Lachnospiraceae bacterium]